jgi:hypothetical protein
MRKEQTYILLACLFAIVLALRLYFAFASPYFSDAESYFHLRHIESIKENIFPLFYDPLSFSGRLFIFSPLFHYIFALLTSFGSPWYLTKIIPNVFAASLLLIIYFLVEYITKNRPIALFSACVSAFTPIYFVETVNALSPLALTIPVTFLFLLCFYRIQQRAYATLAVFLLCFLILLSPTSLLLLFGLAAYLFLQRIYDIPSKKEEKEFIFFSLILAFWFYLLLYKRALLDHGINILWQNIPTQLIDKYYYNITIISSIYHIGIIPLLFGLIVIYYILFKQQEEQRKNIFPIVGITFVTTFCLWFKLVEWTIGILYLSILLVILSGYGYMLFHNYILKTKIRGWSNIIFGIVFCLFILSSILPTLYYSKERIALTITTKEVLFLTFLPEMTQESDIILALVDDGHYIEYFGNRKVVADSNFIQIHDTKQRLRDIETVFMTKSKTIATRILNRYNATYIYVSPSAKRLYDIEFLPYEDNDCIALVYTGEVRLYKSTCSVKGD